MSPRTKGPGRVARCNVASVLAPLGGAAYGLLAYPYHGHYAKGLAAAAVALGGAALLGLALAAAALARSEMSPGVTWAGLLLNGGILSLFACLWASVSAYRRSAVARPARFR